MAPATYDRMPASIRIREIHVSVGHPGFRVESFVVVTTLTDSHTYTGDDIGQLYGRRWLAELDIRTIKITIGMDDLRCKTPPMVRKEMWTCLLAGDCRQLQVIVVSGDSVAARLVEVELENLAHHTIGHRPGRVEPRAVKRRPKPHDLLMQPREQARAKLLEGKSS